MVNLVRIYLDKLNKPKQAIIWADKYLSAFPDRIMAPHMYLYKIRAFLKLGQTEKAEQIKLAGIKKFKDTEIQIINSEDRLVQMLSFSNAIKTIHLD